MSTPLVLVILASKHTAFIAGAWAVAAAVLVGLLAQSLISARRNRARLAMLEKMAPKRRRRGDDEPRAEEEGA